MLLIHFLLCYNPVFTSVENGIITQTKRKLQGEIFFCKKMSGVRIFSRTYKNPRKYMAYGGFTLE